MTEAQLLEEIRALSTGDTRLFRMQSGAFSDVRGNYVTVGFKGISDLIGWRSVLITSEHVGQRFAQFAAVEVKRQSKRPTPEQMQFVKCAREAGGLAGVAWSVEDARFILQLPRA